MILERVISWVNRILGRKQVSRVPTRIHYMRRAPGYLGGTKPFKASKSILTTSDFSRWSEGLNRYKLFFPNWGDRDASVSVLSNGRELDENLNYQYDEFVTKYGYLTTDLGYGLVYSIVVNAIEEEDRSIKSALREAIVRSGDPMLCVAVVKDYCTRKAIHFEKYEKISIDILKRREVIYNQAVNEKSEVSPIDFESLPSLTDEEKENLDNRSWLFNGKIVEIYPMPNTNKLPLYIMVNIPTLKNARLIREFNKRRRWILGQNVVAQWDGEDLYRILDFND